MPGIFPVSSQRLFLMPVRIPVQGKKEHFLLPDCLINHFSFIINCAHVQA